MLKRDLLGEFQSRNNPFAPDYEAPKEPVYKAPNFSKRFADDDSSSDVEDPPVKNSTTSVEMTESTPFVLATNPFQNFTVEESSDDEQATPLDFESSNSQFQDIYEDIERMDQGISQIQHNIQKYERCHTNNEINDLHTQIQNQINDTRGLSHNIGDSIKDLQKKIFLNNDDDTTLNQYNRNQFHRCMKKHQEALESYQGEVEHFRQVRKRRVMRIAQTVGADLSEEKLDEMIENPQKTQQLVQTQLVSTELLENLTHLEETRYAMQNIEQGLKEILEMWQEFNALLALQQERVDSIEDNVAKTHKKVKHATQMLVEAEKDQQCARKNQCYIMICCMVLMFLVFGGVGISFLA